MGTLGGKGLIIRKLRLFIKSKHDIKKNELDASDRMNNEFDLIGRNIFIYTIAMFPERIIWK